MNRQIFVRCADCPANFTYHSTVNGGCYRVVTRHMTWDDAGLNCRAIHKDAHLLVINDAAEQSAVAEILASVSSLYSVSYICSLHYDCITEPVGHMTCYDNKIIK